MSVAVAAAPTLGFGEAYLVYPDLFPARAGGESWGDQRLDLALGGGPYRFDGLSAAQAALVRRRFGPLCAIEGDGDGAGGEPAGCAAEVFRVAAADFIDFERRGWRVRFDLDPSATAVRIAGDRFIARLEWRPGRTLTAALWTPLDGGDDFLGIFENFWRVLAAYRLLDCGGVLLHSCGIAAADCAEPGARVFFGRSGAGKSTLARLGASAGLVVLSDELNALWPRGGSDLGVEVERVPFAGDFGQRAAPPASFPLRGLFRLRQDPADAREPLPLSAAVAGMLACAPFVNADPFRAADLLANLEALARAVPVETLRFSLAGGVWDTLGIRPPFRAGLAR